MLKKLVYSLVFGTSIGAGPYAVATTLPSSTFKTALRENIGFGKICLLDKEICAFMAEKEFKQDTEKGKPIIQEKDKENSVEKDYEQQWENFLKKRDDDFCGFGFLGYKQNRKNPPKIDVNTLEKCHKTVVENVKKKMQELEKSK